MKPNDEGRVESLLTLPSWYVTPGKVARKPGGLISASWIGMTPHAPCTPNCSQKAPAERALNELGRIQSGMKAPAHKTKMIMVRRRPMYCDTVPAMAPPLECKT